MYNGSYSATIELLLWSESQATGSEVDDTIYTINITSAPGETWTSTVQHAARRKLITLSYNTNYSLDVMATNCAGHSEVYTIASIFIGKNANIYNTLCQLRHPSCTRKFKQASHTFLYAKSCIL